MARKPIGPFVVIAALAAMAFGGAQVETYEVKPLVHCNYELARAERPAADILFVGNSRAGSAIDPVYLGQRIERMGGLTLSVDRLSLPGTAPAPLVVLTHEYLRNRGFPRVAVVQLSYNRFADSHHAIDLPVHDLHNIAFGQLDDLLTVQRDAVLNDYGAALPRWLERGYQSPPALAMAKLTTNVYAFLRYPIRAVAGGIADCSGQPGMRQMPLWQYGDLSDNGSFPDDNPSVSEIAEWRGAISELLPVDPTDPSRTFENHQFHNLIAALKAGGSTVYLTFYPTLSEPLSSATQAKIRAEFPEATFIDVVSQFRAEAGPNEASKFRDGMHVNRHGALLVSRAMADNLAERLK